MPKFITRIQLHDAGKEDYQQLQTELEKASFKAQKVKDIKIGNAYTDKTEYNREGDISIQDVTRAVVKAVAKIGKRYSYTIIKSKSIYN